MVDDGLRLHRPRAPRPLDHRGQLDLCRWFTGGNQAGDLDNTAFVAAHLKGRGASATISPPSRPKIKMGDSPSLAYLLGPTSENPAGGLVGADTCPWRGNARSPRAPTTPPTSSRPTPSWTWSTGRRLRAAGAKAKLVVDKQEFAGFADGAGVWHFLFSPKLAATWSYRISSNHSGLDGRTGGFTSVNPAPGLATQPSARFPNWWTDDPDPRWSEGPNQGALTVSRWREQFLRDFAARMLRCEAPRP